MITSKFAAVGEGLVQHATRKMIEGVASKGIIKYTNQEGDSQSSSNGESWIDMV